jgi:hypothetical protein
MGHRGPVLRPRCIGPRTARTQILFVHSFIHSFIQGVRWSLSHSGHLTTRKSRHVHCTGGWGAPRPICFGVVKRISPSPPDCPAIPTVLSQCPWNIVTHINPINAQLNPICHLLALLVAYHILHVSRIRVNCNGTVVFV